MKTQIEEIKALFIDELRAHLMPEKHFVFTSLEAACRVEAARAYQKVLEILDVDCKPLIKQVQQEAKALKEAKAA